MARSQTGFGGALPGRRHAAVGWVLLVPAFLLAGGLGGFLLANVSDLSLAPPLEGVASQASLVPVTVQQFPVCAGMTQASCVVDGDTFWLQGTKIRIADIDTPEISKPQCDQEAALARRATLRMRELLSAGAFELAPVDRDEDVYGRKLRIVMRDGASIGEILVAEGLAQRWIGYQQDWC